MFQDQTAAGKLNAEMTPTTPSGCHVSAGGPTEELAEILAAQKAEPSPAGATET